MQRLFLRSKLALVALAFIGTGILTGQTKPVTASETFQVTGATKIAVGTIHHATLADVKVGDRVSITYEMKTGILVAHHIADKVPHAPRKVSTTVPTTPATPPVPRAKKPSSYSHVHGVVQTVDGQGGTLTISCKTK